jgi:hypothetical protein
VSPPSADAAAPIEVEHRRHGVLGTLAAALPDREGRRSPERPDLRVVAPARRRRPGWQVGTLAGALLFVALFAIAGAHTLIVQQQRHIDDVNGRITEAEERAEVLRTDLAELESPERIVREAKETLGMIEAPAQVYLQPRPDDDVRAAEVPPTTPPTTAASTPTTTAGSTTAGVGR